jgi:hypothetical protein
MSETTENLEQTYQQTYDQEYRGLERRREHDPCCSIKDIEGILKNLYIWEGNNWDGRGETAQAGLAATIAAYEAFIENWKKEQSA